MLLVKSTFKTVVHTRNDTTMRVCTGEEVTTPCGDDVSFGQEVPEGVLPIQSRKDVKTAVTVQLAAVRIWLVFLFVTGATFLYRFCVQYATAGHFVFSLEFVVAIFCIVAFILYSPTAFNPVVHDWQGHWVNLRTGSTNLCDGTVIRKKARWP